ncbi:transmembrane protein 14C-like protein [Sarcoptes scabiei]|uniref:Transmembrane protein 14C-like protein n=1 Tax=Sarcoptes scabiei TaxID=52283 RepID=A0A132ABL5_SARSC|nr:transmembrane protein 14C-like protein [Sarcoptes scabiei]
MASLDLGTTDANNATIPIIEHSSFDSNNLFGLKMPADFLSIGYAFFVACGGIIGYLKAGSIPSLVAGLGFGTIIGIGSYMTSVNPRNYHLLLG